MADDALNGGKAPPQAALDGVDQIVHRAHRQRRFDAAMKVDDLAFGRFAHARGGSSATSSRQTQVKPKLKAQAIVFPCNFLRLTELKGQACDTRYGIDEAGKPA